jgi:hypothetical protein
MSKWFHIVFISLSVLLSLWFGVWGLFNRQIALGIVSLGASVGLGLRNHFMSKLRKLSMKIFLATFALLAAPQQPRVLGLLRRQ